MAALVPQASVRATGDEQDRATQPLAGESRPVTDEVPRASRGAQVLPLPAPDASTARGQEKGNAALKSSEAPQTSYPPDNTESESPRKQ